jgi:hypothetical protein
VALPGAYAAAAGIVLKFTRAHESPHHIKVKPLRGLHLYYRSIFLCMVNKRRCIFNFTASRRAPQLKHNRK